MSIHCWNTEKSNSRRTLDRIVAGQGSSEGDELFLANLIEKVGSSVLRRESSFLTLEL